jgi:hypothetical protein
MKIKFNHPIMTPNGPGLVVGRIITAQGGVELWVSHKPGEVAAEIRAAFSYGGPCFHMAYPVELCNELPVARAKPGA